MCINKISKNFERCKTLEMQWVIDHWKSGLQRINILRENRSSFGIGFFSMPAKQLNQKKKKKKCFHWQLWMIIFDSLHIALHRNEHWTRNTDNMKLLFKEKFDHKESYIILNNHLVLLKRLMVWDITQLRCQVINIATR